MRKLYLIRHGQPDFPEGEHFCLGQTDMPLGTIGRLQACQLGYGLEKLPIEQVFSSPLSRAAETADFIRPSYTILPGLEEMSAGDWDGLSFREIKARWPELYAVRGDGAYHPIPNSEMPKAAQRRFADAVQAALDMSCGDIALVAHTTVNQTLLSLIKGSPPELDIRRSQPYCSYYELGYDGRLCLLSDEATQSHPPLDTGLAMRLMAAAAVPDKVLAHCIAVADQADRICRALALSGLELDGKLIHSAALLHDIARLMPEHPAVGARWLTDLGYCAVGDLIRQHHDPDSLAVNEATVLYIADKCVKESELVPLSLRFESSLARCNDHTSRAAHERRARTALAMQKIINDICGEEVIK